MVLSSRGAAPAPSPRRHDRFVELDGLRGIAACSVVALHFSTLFDRFFPGHERFPVHFLWGGLGVQLFFMISGFVITVTTTRHPTPARFVRARAIRLYPTYWACLTLTVLITWAQNEMTQPWKVTLLNYTMLQSFLRVRDLDGSYWSLAAEITFYALVAALLLLSRRGLNRKWLAALVTLWPVTGLVTHVVAEHTSSTVFRLLDRGIAGEYAALFCIGIVMSQVRSGTRQWCWFLAPLAAVACAAHLVTSGMVETVVLAALIAIFVSVTMVPAVALLRWKALTWLGAISFPLYLLHQNIGYVVLLHTADPLGPWLSRAVAFTVIVVMAWVVHELVEVRLGRVLTRRFEPRDPVRSRSEGGH